MNTKFECLYCGHKWDEYVWGGVDRPYVTVNSGTVRCPKCSDTNLRELPLEHGRNRDVFGYGTHNEHNKTKNWK